ncbi:MAG: efflux RND transporter periplasmic adaptor subunit [Candidatus Latescibacteria bacterium]|nr:efflux RND transporter periplasmic adaptor subunit [Candidatus Latescibacterota bacterium]
MSWCRFAGVLLLAAGTVAGCGGGPPAQAQGARKQLQFPVEVAPVEARRVDYRVDAVGSVEAFEVVQVTARVSGVVEQVRFTEGQTVAKDQVLVEIEPDRFRLAVEAAKATLAKAQAAQAEAGASLKRREGAVIQNPGLIPGEELETWRTRVNTAQAEVAQARSAMELAELNLHDALVRAPVGGAMQTRTVQTGQYVQPGATLATLVRRDPLLLRFQVPEQDAVSLKPGTAVSFAVRDSQHRYSARISHVAESADLSSRMVPVTAQIDDPARGQLRAGAFAQVSVPVGESVQAPVVPQIAVRPSERGFLAFVVKDNTAQERILTLGMRTAEGLVEIRTGLQAGELLVVRGAEALFEGASVKVSGAAPAQEAKVPTEK